MRAADVVAKRLYDAGCRWAFGMPGGEVLTLVDALEAAGITFVLCKHENAAGFMAEGTYHRTGAPGILVATLGPGALNGINVVENARQDRVPMIVLTGCVDADTAQTYTHQVLDQPQVFRPITKATFTLVANAAHVIADKALAIATEGRPGPVHIDVPISVADAPASGTGALRVLATPMAPAGPDLERARAALRSAKRPLIIAGVDAMAQDAASAVQTAVDALGAPLITTYKAKGLVPEDHPLVLGGAGLSPKADAILLPLVAEADVILCIGYDPIEMRPGWQNAWDPARQMVIDITAEPNHHYMHQSTLNIVGDCAASVAAMLPDAMGDVWPGETLADTKAKIDAAFAAPDAWGPHQVIATCQGSLPDDTLITADSGAHRILLSQMWQCGFPRALTQSSGLCTMGCAVPLAMGAQIVEPDRPVVSFSGDAGFLMVAGELATAAELGLKTIFVVFVDASLALIEMKQRGRQMANRAVDFGHTDFAAVARAFGGAGHQVRSGAELEAALQDALKADTFTVIAAEIDRGAYDGAF
ncbi:thiamine pyrophosphate-binding protein [Shimia abyssi]|uniref:Acetolactate synthase-1/2/3 large subunit n=1 Tax=Shimia abyssi TaxID=1662395 RepID=A0A2P8FBI9_9RHOB|nr:thiamine pyrophosphate-binding protein [Shimia abyssi]PSL19070.1 acetolactate synthase-1/2/3 large subunit [Shimia abyssi]